MAKRANGEGSIYLRKDGRYAASISVGKGKRKHFLGHTRAEVSAKLAEALVEHQKGLPIRVERQNVEKYLTAWLESAKPSLKPRTSRRYEELIRCHVFPTLGKTALAGLKPQQLQRLYGELLDSGLSAGTVRQLHAVLHKALRQAVQWNHVGRNVADAVTSPRPRRLEMKTLSPEQVRHFIEAARGDRFEALFVLAVTTGMRQGELLALRWKDVDLEGDSVRVQTTLQRTKEGFVFADPKTVHSRRRVMLTEVGRSALERHRVNLRAERLLAGGALKDDDIVFAVPSGGPVDGTHLLRQWFYPLLQRAELPRIRFHDLRHTAATLLLGQGVHPKIVSEMLGHSNIYITLDLYSHVTETMQKSAVSALDSLLS